MDKIRLAKQLRIDEAVRPKVYNDSLGIPTIGVGRNLKDKGLSDTEITFLLGNDIEDTCRALDGAMPWWRTMSEGRQQVFANMCFNMGLERFKGFKNMIEAAKSGDYERAAIEMMNSKWAGQVGERARRLKALMLDGE